MKPCNLHYVFNSEYYSVLGLEDDGARKTGDDLKSHYKECNEIIATCMFYESTREIPLVFESMHFVLKVTYPGLLAGLGYPHEIDNKIGGSDDAIKLGFSLDFVSGLPVIPGSTIKGILRSAFKNDPGYVKEQLTNLGVPLQQENIELIDIEDEIFGKPALKGHAKGIDAFLDAIPIKHDKPDIQGYVLNLENITPHRRKGDLLSQVGLKDPIPLRLLKVRPKVEFLFRFILQGGLVDIETKCLLFKQILLDMGVGAKTNVGFGGMLSVQSSPPYHELIAATAD